MRIYSELYTSRPPADVWRCFPDVSGWSRWSPICEECRIADGRPLEVGSTLVMRLRILGLMFIIRAPVVHATPGEVIGWEFRRFGVTVAHTYRLRAQGTGTLISNEEVLLGLPGPLGFLVRAWFASADLSRRSLRGIRAQVEGTGGAAS